MLARGGGSAPTLNLFENNRNWENKEMSQLMMSETEIISKITPICRISVSHHNIVMKDQQVRVIRKNILSGIKCKYVDKLSCRPFLENILKAYMHIVMCLKGE